MKTRRMMVVMMAWICAVSLWAVPARRGWVVYTQPDGSTVELWSEGDESYHYYLNRAGKCMEEDSLGYWQVVGEAPDAEQVMARRSMQKKEVTPRTKVGTLMFPKRGIIILVNYADSVYTQADSLSAMKDMITGEAYHYAGATGSVRQYFCDQSKGKYNPQFDVVGPVNLPKGVSYYGKDKSSKGDDQHAGDMVVEACIIADTLFNVDFTQYDANKDGKVDFVYILFAGKGQADGGATFTIWPHAWTVPNARSTGSCTYSASKCKVDGLALDAYACSAELNGATGDRSGIGTLCHEFSHVIGMPDYYDTGYGTNWNNWITPSYWSLMDQGCYSNEGMTPPNYSIYDRCYMGWDTVPVLPITYEPIEMTALGNEGYSGYMVNQNGTWQSPTQSGQCYYLENRQQEGWDAAAPGHGLVIWNVNYSSSAWSSNKPNTTANNPRCTIFSASGMTTYIGLNSHAVYGKRDPFPGVLEVTQQKLYDAYSLYNIEETEEGVIRFVTDNAPTELEVLESAEEGCRKVLYDGRILIERDGKYWDLLGRIAYK